MELIPILSTIILVATISTFILAVGAYILYKIREGKAQHEAARQPENLQAEYIVPEDRPRKKFFVEDVELQKPEKISVEEKFEPVKKETASGEIQNEIFEREVIKEPKVVVPVKKFVNVQKLNNNSNDTEYNSGDLKWR